MARRVFLPFSFFPECVVPLQKVYFPKAKVVSQSFFRLAPIEANPIEAKGKKGGNIPIQANPRNCEAMLSHRKLGFIAAVGLPVVIALQES